MPQPPSTANECLPGSLSSSLPRRQRLAGWGRLLSSRCRRLLQRPFYRLYELRLARQARAWAKPHHIGIILDGNRRYAREFGLDDIIDGHALGAEKLNEVLDWCYEYDIRAVTIWIFSLDNFHRDPHEVEGLLKLIEDRTRTLPTDHRVTSNRIRVRYIGRLELLPESLQAAIRETESATREYDRFVLNVAIAYGGREEITDAFRAYLRDQQAAGHQLDEIIEQMTQETIGTHLYTSGLPDPDLIIRTSGEVRLSGFMLWQSAYAEFYFCDTFWPDFRKIDFLRALRSYHLRQRRFGR